MTMEDRGCEYPYWYWCPVHDAGKVPEPGPVVYTPDLLTRATTAECKAVAAWLESKKPTWADGPMPHALDLAAAALSLIAEGRERGVFKMVAGDVEREYPHLVHSFAILRQLAGPDSPEERRGP